MLHCMCTLHYGIQYYKHCILPWPSYAYFRISPEEGTFCVLFYRYCEFRHSDGFVFCQLYSGEVCNFGCSHSLCSSGHQRAGSSQDCSCPCGVFWFHGHSASTAQWQTWVCVCVCCGEFFNGSQESLSV